MKMTNIDIEEEGYHRFSSQLIALFYWIMDTKGLLIPRVG